MRIRLFVLLVTLALLGNVLLGVRLFSQDGIEPPEDATGYRDITTLTRAMQIIRQDYVDADKVSYRGLVQAALKGMLESLDPHSQYMDLEDYQNVQDDSRGDFGGIGVVVSLKDGVLTVVSPMEGTPGFEAGLLPGDQILKIDGTSTDKMELGDAVKLLRGQPGAPVTLTVLRPSSSEIMDHEIVREVIPIDSVRDVRMLETQETGGLKIGYARVTQFSQPTANELREAVDSLLAKGMQAFVLDLRYNPGGLLNSARDVSALFLEPGQIVVTTEGRLPSQRQVFRTPRNYKPLPKFPMVILINNGSASGSEIVAGALKDLGRAIVLGETSFGKGSVQSVIELNDGTALRLTTAKYFTPGHQVIHENGVTPHIRVTLTPEQERAVLMLRRENYLDEKDRQMLAEIRDIQLDRAIDVLNALTIYAKKQSSNHLQGIDLATLLPIKSKNKTADE